MMIPVVASVSKVARSTIRPFALLRRSLGSETQNSWRRQQLDKLEQKHVVKGDDSPPPSTNVSTDAELQQHWKSMEGRVTSRRLTPLSKAGEKVGRRNVRKTDEDVWLENGLYEKGEK